MIEGFVTKLTCYQDTKGVKNGLNYLEVDQMLPLGPRNCNMWDGVLAPLPANCLTINKTQLKCTDSISGSVVPLAMFLCIS